MSVASHSQSCTAWKHRFSFLIYYELDRGKPYRNLNVLGLVATKPAGSDDALFRRHRLVHRGLQFQQIQ